MPIEPANKPGSEQEIPLKEDEVQVRPTPKWPFLASGSLPDGERVVNSERRE